MHAFCVFSLMLQKSFYSLSFELVVVSFMQEAVYTGHTALAFTHGLQVFNLTGATTMSRLLGPTTCLSQKDGDTPLCVLPKDTTSKLAGFFSTLSLFCQAPSLEAVNTMF